ncbi:MAG: T9SS type A sorting domain-containing protein [Taibaiella sp.]|nr:T9SS type A sorting domain-containing protein [Taibaiella sp.]
MKNLSCIFMLCLLSTYAYAQPNLVPNGDFETSQNCTQTYGWPQNCVGWSSFNGSPDYFQVCSSTVPSNAWGWQMPASGNAYMGIADFSNPSNYGIREAVTRSITPMVPGVTYQVSLSYSAGDKSRYSLNSVCVHFFDNGGTTFASRWPFTPSIHFSPSTRLTDTANWVRLTATFYADSAYDNIAIGPFVDTPALLYQLTNFPSSPGYGTWYIDSVVVRVLDSLGYSLPDSQYCVGDSLYINYFVANKRQSNNVFNVQLSDKNGSFSSATIIGSKTSDSSGTIGCKIPNNVTNSTGYKIRIIATNPADTSFTRTIKIGNPDSTNITASSNSPLCEGTTLQLSASTFISGTTYNWTGPNSFTSSTASPTILGASPLQTGDYIVTMKWYGCEVKDTQAVTVKPLPATPIASSNSPICAGETLNLTATTSTSGVSWGWTGPGSYNSTAQNPSISNTTVGMSGVYTATATLNGCSRLDTVNVMVNPAPTPVSAGSNSPVCAGDTLHITIGTSFTGVAYSWAGPNSFTANTQNTFVANSSTAASGWYVATLNLNGCIFKDSTQATVHPIPATPSVSYSNPMCVGETLQLNATTVSGATYSWTGVGNYSSTQQNPTRGNMQFGDTGTYSVTATANGCTSPAGSIKVNINPLPFVVIFPTPGDSICVGEQATFTALPNNHGGTPTYQWRINGVLAGSTATTYSSATLNHSDVVRVDMTEYTKCRTNYVDASNEVEMKVLPWLAPSVTISANPNRPLNVDEYVTFTATPTNGGNNPKYQWKRNGQDVQGATGPVWSANTLNDNDSISVELISNYRCPQPPTASSNGIRVHVLTGIGRVGKLSSLSLYPNPNKGSFVLSGWMDNNEPLRLDIINTIGQVVHHEIVTTNRGELNKEIQPADLPNGIYMLRLKTNEEINTIRFRVEK